MPKKYSDRSADNGGRLAGVSGALLVRRFTARQPEMYRVIEMVSARRLTSIDKAALCELAQTAMDMEFDGVEGDFIQAGCGQGGAAMVMTHAKRRNRPLIVYDAARARKDGIDDERQNAQLVTGPYDETVALEGEVALAHLDTSSYESMRVLLERLAPRLVPGGHLIIDDYKTKDECRRAVDEYFRGKSGFELVRKSRLHIIRR